MDFNSTQMEFGIRRNAIRNKFSNKKQIVIMEHQAKLFAIDNEMQQELLKLRQEEEKALAEYQRKRDLAKAEIEQVKPY